MTKEGRLCFATFFPSCRNIHLTKDVGMMLYIMHRDLGYESWLLCYLETEVPGLNLSFIKNKIYVLRPIAKNLRDWRKISTNFDLFSTIADAFVHLWRHGKKIDVLQLYHLNPESILVGLLFRLINRKEILYLKLDMNPDIISVYRKEKPRHSLSLRYLLFMLASFDIISVETRELYHFLRAEYPFFQRFKDKIYYIPNGIDVSKTSAFAKRFRDKENIILHIGRIGAHQKASEIILEAFSRVCQEFPDWKASFSWAYRRRLLGDP